MVVKGDNRANQIEIKNCFFDNALSPVVLVSTADAKITESYFEHGDTTIKMRNCKGFNLSHNKFISFDCGLSTRGTIQDTSIIEDNLFYDVQYGIKSANDNHSKLDTNCNAFSYSAYGIFCAGTTLKS